MWLRVTCKCKKSWYVEQVKPGDSVLCRSCGAYVLVPEPASAGLGPTPPPQQVIGDVPSATPSSTISPPALGGPGGAPPARLTDPQRRARAFSLTFATLFILGLGAMAGTNYGVNPWGLYPTRAFAARVVDDAQKKCDLLRQFKPGPQQLVLGSSRVMRFEPRYLEQISGLRTFNGAVSAAGPVDSLAMYRYAREELKAPLKRVIIGVDTLAFYGKRGNYERLKLSPELRHLIPRREEGLSDASTVSLLLSPAQLRDSLLSLQHHFQGEKTQTVFVADREFEPDGYRGSYSEKEKQITTEDFEHNVQASLPQPQYNPAEAEPNPFVVRELDLLLEKLKQDRIDAVVFVTTEPRPLRERWQQTGFHDRERKLASDIKEKVARAGHRFLDLSDLASFKGLPGGFYDPIHPTVSNTRQMAFALVGKPGTMPPPVLPSKPTTLVPAAAHVKAEKKPGEVEPPKEEPQPEHSTSTLPEPRTTSGSSSHSARINKMLAVEPVDDARRKCELLKSFKPGPQQLVLGSSRVMRIEPKYLQHKTGLRTFNAAVAAGGPVDCLALYRYAREKANAPVKRVLVGMDTLAFFSDRGNYTRLLDDPELAMLIPARPGEAIPPAVIHSDGPLTRTERAARIQLASRHFERDGYRGKYTDRDQPAPLPRFNEAVQRSAQEPVYNPLLPDANPYVVMEFEALLQRLQQDAVEAIIFVTPAPPATRKHWQETGFELLEQGLIARLSELCTQYGVRFADLSRVESFHGQPNGFYDPIHPMVVNTRRMVDTLLARARTADAL